MGSAKPPGAPRPLQPATPRPLGREGGREGAREGTRQSPGPRPAGARPAAGGGRRRARPRSAALPLAARGAEPELIGCRARPTRPWRLRALNSNRHRERSRASAEPGRAGGGNAAPGSCRRSRTAGCAVGAPGSGRAPGQRLPRV